LAARPAGANVGVTQGFIAGTISFDADFVPDSMDVAAGDVAAPHLFVTHGSATFVGSVPQGGGRIVSTWSYDIPVEAAAAPFCAVRPVAHITSLAERVPFPDSAAVGVSPGNTSALDIAYRPVVVTGSVSVADLGNAPLPLRSVLFSAYDVTGAPSEAVQ